MSTVIITAGPTGGVKNRLDIRDFVKNEKFFTLYIRALKELQDRNQDANDSFFQLGGIHGLPHTVWPRSDPVKPHAGYCAHGIAIFPTWHRPYVSLYEQMLQGAAQEIAKKFTTADKNDWVEAANDLRQPFWDWGLDELPPSQIISDEEVSIVDYDGSKITVKNPILRYRFNPIDPSFSGPFANWQTTVRHPDQSGNEDIPGLIESIRSRTSELREETFHMLTKNKTWDQFSNNGVSEGSTSADSLEMIHGSIHVMIGGHMGRVPYAGFDPIFWLHHCNVDRYLSLWRAMNYDVWVPEDSVKTALEPFYKTQDSFWDSIPLTDTEGLGYSYPDFDPVRGADEELISEYIRARVSLLYGFKKPERSSNPALDLLASFESATSEHEDQIDIYDWTIHVTFKHYELKDSFSIVFYFAEDGGTYNSRKHYIGTVDAFRGTTADTCDNCAANSDLVTEAYIHLDPIIARDLGTFDPDQVHDYLAKKKLSYKVLTDEGPLTSLTVKVEGTPYTLPPRKTRPKLDEAHKPYIYDDVTTIAA